ncbi:MAG: WYL domain-containing protein [Pseudomonadota bacterium]|nr:WYL domain-containing protein [Pseudomonadota bacterium]
MTQRTTQRDLKALSSILPGLQVDDEKDYPGWSWSKETKLKDIPTMDGNMALTFQLVDHFLKEIFPPSVIGQLKPYFDSAENILTAIDNQGYSHWQEKVRILPRTQPLIPATIEENVISIIYEALFKGLQIRARYRPRYGDEAEYDLHPLGLIFRESVVYLVATIWDYHDPRHLALHRFKHCELLDKNVTIQDGFDLDKYLAAGSFEYGENENETIKLKALFFDHAGHHLLETPLSLDQKSSELNDGQLQIEATVKNSAQLSWWLMGFGDGVEVLAPKELREEFEEIAENLLEIYQG